MDVRILELELLTLRHDLHQLKVANQELAAKHISKDLEIAELIAENTELRNRLYKLEDKLNVNSGNSGLPTSKEIYRAEKHSKPKSGLKPGGQPGHQYKGYEFKMPDAIIDVLPAEKQCVCGGELEPQTEYKAHQKIEIPPIKPFVTEYRLHDSCCTVCAKRYRSKLASYKLLDKNAESIITALSGFFNNSKRDVQSILSQIFNLDISLGLISGSEARVSQKLESKYGNLVEEAESSAYLHLDETSSYKKGKLGWCWIAANKSVSVFKLLNSRGKKALETFLPEYEGKVITDRYAVYNIYDSANRQICLAHLRRDFKRFAHSKYPSLSIMGRSLIEIIDSVFGIYKLYKSDHVEKLYYLRRMRKLKKRMFYYLKEVSTIRECAQACRVARNILKSFDMMWLFLEYEEIEPTNNFAERQIKHYVKYRKNSLFTWSNRGERFIERIKSIFATAQLQKINPYELLTSFL